MPPSVTSSLAVVSLTLLGALPAGAEQRLHERIINPNEEDNPLVEQPADGRNPAALRLPNIDVAEPEHSSELQSGEGVFGQPNPNTPPRDTDRLRRWRPDLLTAQTAEELHYHSSFSPSIAPYKRMSALDQVEADYSLSNSSPSLEAVPVGGRADTKRDLFWGSVVVRLVPNQPVPIPSVAPNARILSVSARPEVEVEFFKDGADNFFVVSPHAGQHRLVFVTDAPASYFGGAFPQGVTADTIPTALRPRLPRSVERAAATVASRLGLDRSAPIERNLTRLVTYLRSFSMERLEVEPGTDPYVALAFGRKGVCRHRAFVFVVTAQSLGIPARFVTNEVHAFSEVYIPNMGWVRIDLGGEARLDPESEAVVAHQPRSPDPIPWPPGSRGAGTRSSRASAGHLAGRGESTAPGQGSSATTQAGGNDRVEHQQGDRAEPATEGASNSSGQISVEAGSADVSSGLAVVLDRYSTEVIRGEPIAVEGVAEEDGDRLPRAQVTFWLSGSSPDLIRLGRLLCDGEGRFSGQLTVPGTLSPGSYGLVIRATPRDE